MRLSEIISITQRTTEEIKNVKEIASSTIRNSRDIHDVRLERKKKLQDH